MAGGKREREEEQETDPDYKQAADPEYKRKRSKNNQAVKKSRERAKQTEVKMERTRDELQRKRDEIARANEDCVKQLDFYKKFVTNKLNQDESLERLLHEARELMPGAAQEAQTSHIIKRLFEEAGVPPDPKIE